MMNQHLLLALLLASSGFVHCTHLTRQRPSFVTEPQNLIVEKQASVVLNCTIQDLGSYSATWRYLDHDITISVNETIYASHKDHYKILRPPVSETKKSHSNWFLEIKNVDVGDIGYYSCEVDGIPGLLQVSLIKLEGVAAPPKPNVVQKTNYTACCKKDKVMKTCLPMCSPHTFDSETFHYELCHKNLSAILNCGSDGRNHVPCCRQRQVPDQCLDLCLNQVNFTDFTTHMAKECYDRMKDITECFAEGQVALPGPPVKIHSNAVSKMSVFVGWDMPKFNKELVTGYRLFYAKADATHFTATPVIQQLYHILTNLEKDTFYKMYVQAISNHGSSLPSYLIKVFVKDITPVDGGKIVMDCCKIKGVSSACQPILCGGPNTQTIDSGKMMDCVGDFQKSLSCYSGGRDHTPCCLSKGVHASCLDFCKGTASPVLDINHLMCVSYMNDISNCLMEGLGILPAAPEDILISAVTMDRADIYWKPPATHPERVMHYIIKYKPKHSNLLLPMEIRVDNRTLNTTLKNLTKGTLYETYVLAGNSAGTSPPSSVANFLTYSYHPDSGIVLPPAQKAPYNVTECCIERKLNSECLPMCSFKLDITILNRVPSFCKSDLAATKTILACGTDDRDHTPCCKREQISAKCLETCRMTHSGTLDVSHKECFINMTTIYKCYEEGNALLPLPPRDLKFKSVTAHTMSISWMEPAKAPEGVLFYIVEYKKDGETEWMQEKTVQKEFTVQHLKPDSRYSVRVKAGNKYGTSLHGNAIGSEQTNAEASGGTTPTQPPPPKPITNVTQDISECCAKSSVSDPCKKLCTGARLGSMLQCKNDFNKIISCAADKRDHSKCCKRRTVPSFCIKYCRGESADQLTALACATHLEQIRGCFFEGYNTLPSPPLEFTITKVMVDEIDSAWKPSTFTHDKNIIYNQHYDEGGPYINKIKENVKSPYKLGNLTENTLYDLYTVSENQYGTSLPSASFSVYTYEKGADAFQITVSYSPKGYIREGQDVTLKCVASAAWPNPPTIQWGRKEKKLIEASEYKLTNVKIADRGLYSCEVKNNNDKPIIKSIYLRMQYRPTVAVKDHWVDVLPRQHKNATLSCSFEGYPEKLVWYFNGYEMDKFTYAYVTTKRDDATGITKFNLMVEKVISSDYGTYSCVGSTPGLGQARGYIHLYDNTTSTPPEKPAAKVLNVTDCCVIKGVAKKCQVACQFDVDLTQIKDVLVDCVKDLKNIMLCGADGKDHTVCCKQNSVPLECQSFCAGVVPKVSMDKMLYCLGFSTQIISCMEQGSVLIPSAPRNLRGTSGDDWINMKWDPPLQNPDFVQQYAIYYRTSSGGKERMVMVGPKANDPRNFASSEFRYRTQVRIENIGSGREYTIYAIARNHHGKSAYSNTLIISTTGKPNPPQQLICVPTNTNLRLSWNAPMGSVHYYQFHVYYRADEVTDHYTEKPTGAFNYLIDELLPGQQYTIYVTSVNKVGQSVPSNKCHVYAPGKAPPKTTPAPSPTVGRSNIGLGIGLGFVLVILLIALGVLGWYMWKKRGATAGKKPTVSFENPAYKPRTDNPDATGGAGAVQISGLPNQEEQPIQAFTPLPSTIGPRPTAGANGTDTVIGNPHTMPPPPADNDLGVSLGQLDVNRLDPNQVKVEINYDTGVSES
ncbi:Ig-like and fibronectin type-III domain-containing protein 2 isoform X2 [Lineus longissimus]|uniref:Ig-like and fibronectin type-III domain-containing protein 2 isoform X2 n=1 Tax=Lineus longissimus TaxID=88925 RepID=UPI002B4F5F3A